MATIVKNNLNSNFAKSVFINCPFDTKFKPLLDVILFTIHDCDFTARHALESIGGKESRLAKIYRLINESQWSIHDLSRVQLSTGNKLPRFNMPFECGLAFGAMQYGKTNQRDALVLTGVDFQDKASLSDLAGIDPGYHQNNPQLVISRVRKFLASKSSGKSIRGANAIFKRYKKFNLKLHTIAQTKGISKKEIESFDYINDWVGLAIVWMAANPN
jgi:hypothetical protein